MPGEGLTDIHIEGERLVALEDVLGGKGARASAEEHKVKAFGLLAGLLSRPKPEDIEITLEEKHFDAFWRVSGKAHFEYRRKKTYRVATEPMVQEIEAAGVTYLTSGGSFEFEGVERCLEEYVESMTVDAQTGEAGDFTRYAGKNGKTIQSTEELSTDGAAIAALEAKPAFLVRKTLNALIKPFQADQILDERIAITELSLNFIPIYTFELWWKTKDKRLTISFDGATGELMPKPNRLTSKLRQSFTNAELFEFGKEVANFVPGGGLAMMVGKKAIELTKK